jgi:hypothetical protein
MVVNKEKRPFVGGLIALVHERFEFDAWMEDMSLFSIL